jgi:DNA-binding winged helix-turn-helix (wHTH) protein/Tol biopolymer transport system component
MPDAVQPARLVRFATFEADLDNGELRRNGLKLKLSGQPFQVLAILLERPGTVVTREELRKRLWPDTFVDFDHNLNAAINRIREVLGDSAENPRFVETVPKRGYRFIAPVENPSQQAEQTPGAKLLDTSGKPQNRIHFRLTILTAAVLAVGLLAAVWIIFTRPPGAPKVVRFTRLTSDGQRKIGPLVSDGVRVYFNESLPDGRLIIAQASVKGGEVTPLSVPLNAPIVQDISKDGTELLVAHEEGLKGRSLWVQPVAGGSPYRIGTVLTTWGPSWTDLDFATFAPDTSHIVYSQKYDIYSVNRDGSALRKILTVDHLPKDFRYSPESRILRFSQFDPPFEQEKIVAASEDGTRTDKLVDGCCGQWTPDGQYFIFARQSSFRYDLWALREKRKFSWKTRKDAPIQLTAGPLDFRSPLPARSGNGIFVIGTAHRAEFVRYDKQKGEFVPYLPGISAEELAFSLDGQWVAYTSFPEGNLWRSRVDGSEKMQLTFPPVSAGGLRWSPDGKQIAFSAILPGGVWNIYVIANTGGAAERMLPGDRGQFDVGWSPDGKSLIFGSLFDPKAGISIIDLDSRQVSTLPGSRGLFSPHWSPAGRYISGTSLESDNLMLFDIARQSWIKPCECVVGYPIWSHDGKYLYFHAEPGKGGPASPGSGLAITKLRLLRTSVSLAGPP